MIRKGSLLILLVMLFASTLTASAQEGEEPHPDGPIVELSPEEQAAADAQTQAYNEVWVEKFLSRNLTDFNIAYLITENATTHDIYVSADYMAEQTGARVISDWNTFEKLNEETAFQIIFIHESMLDRVDVEWFKEAYRSGVIIAGINIDVDPLADLIGDVCMGKKHDTEFLDQDFYVYLMYHAEVTDPQHGTASMDSVEYQKALDSIHHSSLETCDDPELGHLSGGATHGATASWVESPEDLEGLLGFVLANTVSYGIEPILLNGIIPLPNSAK